ncbi:MAG TPA: sensor domain-containing diguanylate cyclase [Deltaproteobacteria bacterium]|nr:sensor domain-containing diguanylate cyclase [Deltaproteobacteria bacterium]
MTRDESRAPVPTLVVGEGAARVVGSLMAGLAEAGAAHRFSCAAFDSVGPAARSSVGAPHLILIAVGRDAEEILFDPVWEQWDRPGTAMARVALSGSIPSADTGELDPEVPEPDRGVVFRLPETQAEALPMATIVVARLLEVERSQSEYRSQLETERACEALASCLEPGKLYSMTLEILLERLGCRRGIAFFSPSPAPQGAGVAARGFPEEVRDRLSRTLIEEKSLESTMGRGEVSVVPWGPLHHVLGLVGLEAPGALLSVPLRGEEHEGGHVWILSEGRRFDEADLEAARTIARRANAALATAERYHNAKEKAFIDDVTGVYNARYLLATADNEIQRAARYGNPLSVLFLDLDRFKTVNDVHGHLIGSETLRVLSRLLSQCVRQVDTLARYGGDEFTILLVDTPHDVALRIAERIRHRVETHLFEAGREGTLRLTISIGVATCPVHGEARGPLLDAADKAMYRAKSRGRNRVCSADDLLEGDA